MGAGETCRICSSAIIGYVTTTRMGFCKLAIFVFTIVAAILLSANFTNIVGGGPMEFVLGLTNFIWVMTVISILIFAWRWNEWMWGLKSVPWAKVEFIWSLLCTCLLICAALICWITVGVNFDSSTIKGEGLAAGVFCFLASIGYIVIAITLNGSASISLRNVNV